MHRGFEALRPSISLLFVPPLLYTPPHNLPHPPAWDRRQNVMCRLPLHTKQQCIGHTLDSTKDEKQDEAWTRKTTLPSPIKTLQKSSSKEWPSSLLLSSFFSFQRLATREKKISDRKRGCLSKKIFCRCFYLLLTWDRGMWFWEMLCLQQSRQPTFACKLLD